MEEKLLFRVLGFGHGEDPLLFSEAVPKTCWAGLCRAIVWLGSVKDAVGLTA